MRSWEGKGGHVFACQYSLVTGKTRDRLRPLDSQGLREPGKTKKLTGEESKEGDR